MENDKTSAFLVTSAETAVAKTGKMYIKLKIVSEKRMKKSVTLFENEDPDKLRGKVCNITLREQENFPDKVVNIKPLPSEDQDLSPYLRKSKVEAESALAYLKEKTRGNSVLAQVVDQVLFNNQAVLDRFVKWPAASVNHHAFMGGLLEHTYCMARMAEAHFKYDYAAEGLDTDLVMVAIVLHDIGKVITYDLKLSPEISDKVIAESIAASSAEMSERGKLIGHIALGDEMVVRACIELKIPTTKDIILHLRHCMLSHHGKLEFGSPVAPSTHEAVLIGNIDLIQAELQGRMEIIRGLEVGGRQYDKHIKSELYRWR